MPKSKRDKKVSLTKTDKKGLVLKQKIVEDVRNCVEKFNSVYVFTYKNMRTETMQGVRQSWKPSRFFFGKNKIVSLGLGKTASDEIGDGLHKVSKYLKGPCGILFTDKPEDEVLEWFNTYTAEEFARAGFKTPIKVLLNEGPLTQFPHSIEPYLRQLGLPTKLDKGVVTLIKDYEVCKKGDVLTPEQAKIIKMLEMNLAQFKFIVKCSWSKDGGFKAFKDTDVEETAADKESEEDKMDAESEDD